MGAHVADITARAMNGELDFEAALRERVGLLKGLPEAVIGQVLRDRITLMPGGAVLLATMKANGAYAALVSGGFTAFTGAVAATLGFDENRANTLHVEDGRADRARWPSRSLARRPSCRRWKRSPRGWGSPRTRRLRWATGRTTCRCCWRAGTGVALHAKPVVQAQCEVRVNHGDLTALLYLQGYGRDEFVGGEWCVRSRTLQATDRGGEAEADRLGDVGFADVGAAVEVGDGAGDAQDAVIAAGGQAQAFGDACEQGLAFGVGGGEFFQHRAFEIGVDAQVGVVGEAGGLHGRGRRRRGRRWWRRLRPMAGRSRSAKATGGTSTRRSKRSISGPEMRPR